MNDAEKEIQSSKVDNNFEEQHHHLLSCLEHATVSGVVDVFVVK
jgi:hypothetical protein